MRDYSKISPAFWTGRTGRALRGNLEAQIVAFYLLTSPHANMLGAFYCPLIYIAHETGLDIEGARKGLQTLSKVGFCTFEEDLELVWVHEMARFQIGESLDPKDNRCKGVYNEYQKLPESLAKQGFYAKYKKAFNLPEEPKTPPRKRSPSEAPSKPGAVTGTGDRTGSEKNICDEPSSPLPDETENTVILLPLNTGDEHPVKQSLVDEFRGLYPAVDVESELRAMRGWLITNPTKRKTKFGINAFMNKWLAKTQDRGGIAHENNQPGNRHLSAIPGGKRPASPIERRLAARAAEDHQQSYRNAVGQDVCDVRSSLDGEFWRED